MPQTAIRTFLCVGEYAYYAVSPDNRILCRRNTHERLDDWMIARGHLEPGDMTMPQLVFEPMQHVLDEANQYLATNR